MSDIPEGWELSRLGDCCSVIGGGTPTTDEENWNGKIPWASPTDLTALKTAYINRTNRCITETGLAKSSAKIHPVGTVLMTSRATIGYTAINLVPMATNQGFQSLRCSDAVNNLFLHYVISNSRHEFQSKAGGSTFREISSREVKLHKILLPPLHEQRKIAAILSSVDRSIEATERMIGKLEDLKKAMMQELLTQGLPPATAAKHRIPKSGKFKASPVGRIPKEWKVVKIADYSEVITKGTTPTTGNIGGYAEAGVNFLRVENIGERGNIVSTPMRYITHDTHEKLSRSILKDGDILFSIAGALGRCAIVRKEILPANLNQAIAIIRPKKSEVQIDYMLYFMMSENFQKNASDVKTGNAQQNLNLQQVAEMPFAIPSREEQKTIVSILTKIDTRIAKARQRRDNLQSLKKGLMQDLLTGRVRVGDARLRRGRRDAGCAAPPCGLRLGKGD